MSAAKEKSTLLNFKTWNTVNKLKASLNYNIKPIKENDGSL